MDIVHSLRPGDDVRPPTGASPGRLGRIIRLLAGVPIALLFLWLALRGMDPAALGHAVGGVRIQDLALGLCAVAAAYIVRIGRWELMLRTFRPSLPLGSGATSFLIGIAANNILPFRLGDVLRAFAPAARLKIRPERLLGALIVERGLDLLALLSLLAVGLALLAGAEVAEWLTGSLATLVSLAVAITLCVFAAPGLAVRLIVAGLQRRAFRRHRIVRILFRLAGRVSRSLVRLRRRMPLLALLSLLAWALEGLVFAAVGRSFDSTAIYAPWFALSLGNLGTLLPGAPGHVGTFDFFAKHGLVVFGAAEIEAAAAVVVVHGLLWVSVTTAGGIAYAYERIRDLRHV